MKKIILPLVGLLLSATTFAQDWAKDWSKDVYQVGKKYPGYIEMADGKKIEGFIKALPLSGGGVSDDMQTTIVFFANEDDKKKTEKYKAKDKEVAGYKIADKYFKADYYSGGMSKKAMRFLLQNEEACISTYTWFGANGDWSVTKPLRRDNESQEDYFKRIYSGESIFIKGDQILRAQSIAMSWKKKFPPLVSDHPNIGDKVANKEKGYKSLNYPAVIKEYNDWCKNK
jgi:hypothetical protein